MADIFRNMLKGGLGTICV
uniref:Uncharacterized protein n=1 Tax=Anguilla anguilla TaxID=7936 RepID=A0A0E9XDE5_ANGAN